METKEGGLKFNFLFESIYHSDARNTFSRKRKRKNRYEADDQHSEIFETAEGSEENCRM